MKESKKQLELFRSAEDQARALRREELLAEASCETTEQSRLDELAKTNDKTLSPLLAQNPNAPKALLNLLAESHPKEVLENPCWSLLLLEDNPLQGFSPVALRALLSQPGGHILLSAASLHSSQDVRRAVALRPDCPAEILMRLIHRRESSYGLSAIVTIAAEHPNLPKSEAERLLLDEDSSVRRAALLHPQTKELQGRLGPELVAALYKYSLQAHLPLPFSEEQRALLQQTNGTISAQLLLWDRRTPKETLLALFDAFDPEGFTLTVLSLFASHPNCPESLWPRIFEMSPRAFLYQTNAPLEYTQRAVKGERDADFFLISIEENYPIEGKEALHQCQFSEEALRFFISCELMAGSELMEGNCMNLFAAPAIGPHLEEFLEIIERLPKKADGVLRGMLQNEAAAEALLAILFERIREDEELLSLLSTNKSLPLSIQQKLKELLACDPSQRDTRWEIEGSLARNPVLDVSLQWWLFEARAESVWRELLKNPALDEALLQRIFEAAHKANSASFQAQCAIHPRLPRGLFEHLLMSDTSMVLSSLARRTDLTKQDTEQFLERCDTLSKDEQNTPRKALAQNDSLPPELYSRLLEYESCWSELVQNPSAPIEVVLFIAKTNRFHFELRSQKRLPRTVLLELNIPEEDDDIPF